MGAKKSILPDIETRNMLWKEKMINEDPGKRTIYNNPSGKLFCCHPSCNKDATFELRFSSELEDYTHTCDEHLIYFIPKNSSEITLNSLNQ